jgi:phosphoesterase RecJ-like protein
MHETPDADAVGSCFSLVYALRKLGKTAHVACCDKVPASLAFMTDGEREFGIGDLPEGFTPEHFLSADVASRGQFGALREYSKKVTLALDHHATHDRFATYLYVEPKAGACAEIVYRIVNNLLSGKMPEKIASLLYAGLAADTGGFRYANTSPATHKVAAKLIEHGANHTQICRSLFECKSKSALAAESFAMEHVKYLCGGKISYVKITLADKTARGFADEDTYDVINAIRRADGVKIAIFAREKDDGSYKISTRSSCEIDVAKICGIFGGGGHAGAAGCSVGAASVDEAVERIVKECGFDD